MLKTEFEKYFFKSMNNVADIKLVTTESRTNYLVSETNYQIMIIFSENLLAILQIFMIKSVF